MSAPEDEDSVAVHDDLPPITEELNAVVDTGELSEFEKSLHHVQPALANRLVFSRKFRIANVDL